MRVLHHYCYHVISSRVQDSWFFFKSKWPLGGVRGQHQYCTFRRFCYAYIHHPVTSQKTSASQGMQPTKDKYAPANSSCATLKCSYALRPEPTLVTSPLRHYVPPSVYDRCMGEEQITLVCPQTHLLFNLQIGCWDVEVRGGTGQKMISRVLIYHWVFFFSILSSVLAIAHSQESYNLLDIKKWVPSSFYFDLSLYLLDYLFWLWVY